MSKVFVDTNIILDLLAKREPFYKEAAELFSKADNGELELYTSAVSFANTYYILENYSSTQKAKETLRKFKVLIQIISVDDKIIELALNDKGFKDFEDAVQFYAAQSVKVEAILTRNKKDFKSSSIPVFTAKEYLAR